MIQTHTAINRLTLSQLALRHNVEQLRSHLPKETQIMVMLKANGYGTDALMLADALSEMGIGYFGVAMVSEGEALRSAGVTEEILVCYCAPHEASHALQHNLQVAVWSEAQIEALETAASASDKTGKVHLHINTGMNRLGCKPSEAASLAKQISSSPHLELAGLMSHLASAEAPLRDPQTRQQLAHFQTLLKTLDAPLIHMLNSAGALRFSLPESNLVRIGLALFGLSGSAATRDLLPLKCALSLTSELIHIQECQAGEQVSYGGHYVLDRDRRIGVVPLGYYDGIHQCHSGRSILHIRNRAAPIVGSICMDFLMCDLSNIPEAQIGDQVVVFDNNWRPEAFAASAERTIYELITCLGPRVERELR